MTLEMLKNECREEGREEGLELGEQRLSALINHLILDKRSSDIQLALTKPDIRNQLYKEYGL